MGYRFIQAISRRFKNRADMAHATEYGGARLAFVQTAQNDTTYRFKCPDADLPRGERIAFADIGQEYVRVIQDHCLVGEVDGVGSAELRKFFSRHSVCNNVIPAIVTSPKNLAGFARGKIDWTRS